MIQASHDPKLGCEFRNQSAAKKARSNLIGVFLISPACLHVAIDATVFRSQESLICIQINLCSFQHLDGPELSESDPPVIDLSAVP